MDNDVVDALEIEEFLKNDKRKPIILLLLLFCTFMQASLQVNRPLNDTSAILIALRRATKAGALNEHQHVSKEYLMLAGGISLLV